MTERIVLGDNIFSVFDSNLPLHTITGRDAGFEPGSSALSILMH